MINNTQVIDYAQNARCISSRTVCTPSPIPVISKKQKYTHAELVSFGERWLLHTRSCSFAFSELRAVTNNSEVPDNIGFKGQTTILIECKTSRGDFHSDKRKMCRRQPWRGMGDFRFFLCPAKVINPTDLPDGWGLLWVYPSGAVRQQVGPKRDNWNTVEANPFFFPEKDTVSESQMMISALRRLHLRGVLPMIYDNPFAK